MKVLYSILLVIAVLCFGCETTEKIDDFPLRPSKLVVNCNFNADSSWIFQVSKSLSVLDNAQIKLVKNASIKIFKEGDLISTLDSIDQDGLYKSYENLPEAGKEYSIEVVSPDFDEVIVAKDRVPLNFSILDAELLVIDSSFSNNGRYGHLKGSFEISFEDQKSVNNYYRLRVYYMDSVFYYYEDGPEFQFMQKSSVGLSSDDLNVENSGEFSSSLLINDFMFDGQKYTLSVDFEEWNAKRNKTYYIEMTSLTREGFLYRKSINEYNRSRNDPFAEPVIIYSNVSNGFGIFSANSRAIYELTTSF